MMDKRCWGLIGVILLAGCTNREIYEAIQQNRQSACAALSTPQYEQCMQGYKEPYDSYREKREELFQVESGLEKEA